MQAAPARRRIRRRETAAQRYERRLRHLVRMRDWYAAQRGKRDDHDGD
jgi:hypothetical protein